MIIDTHAHIDQLSDFDGAMQRAVEAGVSDIMAMSVDLTSMEKVLHLARAVQAPRIHPALGIHPGTVKTTAQPQSFEFLRAHIHEAKAVGETGLDYWYKWVRDNHGERQIQKDSFALHLQLAKEHDLPIVIHSRGAWRDCLQMTKEAGVKRALFHWYSGPLDILQQIITEGYFVSTSPSVGYSPQSQDAMRAAPIERILIETDCPVRYKDGESDYIAEPKDVVRTLNSLSQLKNMEPSSVLKQVNANARNFFQL